MQGPFTPAYLIQKIASLSVWSVCQRQNPLSNGPSMFSYFKGKAHPKLRVSLSKFSGQRTFNLRYQYFEILEIEMKIKIGYFEISVFEPPRVDRISKWIVRINRLK